MAKPRIFISSTCYDLSLVRDELRRFLEPLGFEVLDSQSAKNFGVTPGMHSHSACIEEVGNSDYLLLIIGGRYGGTHVATTKSITNEEYNKAVQINIPIIGCVDKKVFSLNATYKKNPTADLSPDVTDKRVFHFIDYVVAGATDNWLHQYTTIDDIKNVLITQLAHYLLLFSQNHKSQKTKLEKNDDAKFEYVQFPDNLSDIPDLDQDEQIVFKNGLRALHKHLSSIVKSALKIDAKNEQLKCIWVIGLHGELDTNRIRIDEPVFKGYAWSTTKGDRVFKQMQTYGVKGQYDNDGESEQWIDLRFSSENKNTSTAWALSEYIKKLHQDYGDDGINVFRNLDMRMYSAHAEDTSPKSYNQVPTLKKDEK